MNKPIQSAPFSLAKGGVTMFSDATSTQIRCDQGSLWITQDNDTRDIVLRAGEEFQPDRKGTVLIYALEGSTLSWGSVVAEPAPSAWKTLGAWFAEHFAHRVSDFMSARRPAF